MQVGVILEKKHYISRRRHLRFKYSKCLDSRVYIRINFQNIPMAILMGFFGIEYK